MICGACACVAAAVAETALISILFPHARGFDFSMSESALVFAVAVIAIGIFAVLMVHAVRAGHASRQRRLDVQRGFPVKLR